jgi:TetR/AcrR family transcriptional regulator, cholesterol catabolism regulator
MPKGIPLTEEEQLHRRREIFNASVNLFLEKGFPETSMREIAEAAGMGKSSLYDYFNTKDDILLFIFEEVVSTMIERAQAIAGLSIPPEARITRIMDMQLDYLQENNSLMWLLSAEARRLKPESQQRVHVRRYAFQDLMRSIIEEGISRGDFRQVDTLLAARLMIDSLVSVLYTSRPTGSAKAMLDEAVGIFLRGIRS